MIIKDFHYKVQNKIKIKKPVHWNLQVEILNKIILISKIHLILWLKAIIIIIMFKKKKKLLFKMKINLYQSMILNNKKLINNKNFLRITLKKMMIYMDLIPIIKRLIYKNNKILKTFQKASLNLNNQLIHHNKI